MLHIKHAYVLAKQDFVRNTFTFDKKTEVKKPGDKILKQPTRRPEVGMAMVVATSMASDSREVDKVNVTKTSKRPDTTLCNY